MASPAHALEEEVHGMASILRYVNRFSGLGPARGLVAVAIVASLTARPASAEPGHLLIIGGGFKADNAEVARAIIDLSGGPDRAHIGMIPTASLSTVDARRMVDVLTTRYGLSPDDAEVIDITPANAAQNAHDPAVVSRIRACTGLFFTGGDQARIARAFLGPDGAGTPALEAVWAVYQAGGLISGSSAGAAMMSDPMLSSRGVPIDTLDFGLAADPHHRGSRLEPGLGFFRAGLVDQHFNHRGRLARLTRVLVERKMALGFGIDEDTAMHVLPDGTVEVLGRGGLTVVDAAEADGADGPLGFHASGLTLHYLERGDRFDPASRVATVDPRKAPLVEEEDEGDELGVIADLTQQNAVRRALTAGLVECTSERRSGLFLRYNGTHGHGYRFTFAKTPATRGHYGRPDGLGSYAVLGVRLDIDPVSCTLEPPETLGPRDLDAAAAPEAIAALVFRGVMLCDEGRAFRPSEPLTRAEFAGVLTHSAFVPRRRGPGAGIADVPADDPLAREIAAVVAAGLIALDDAGAFRPSAPITRQEVAAALVRARTLPAPPQLADADPPPESAPADAELIAPAYRAAVFAALRAGLFPSGARPFRPSDPATREEVAVAVARFLGLPW